MTRRVRQLFAPLAILAVGCADGRGTSGDAVPRTGQVDEVPAEAVTVAAPQPALDDDGPTPAEWTAGVVRVANEVTGATILTDVRSARNEGFDRVVLEFDGDEMPSYHIEYVDRPVRQCGSGNPVPIAGDGWLAVRLEPARAHDEEGRATITERSTRPALPILQELTLICDFEAQVEWVLGVSSPNRYRVMELYDPTRLVVDVRH